MGARLDQRWALVDVGAPWIDVVARPATPMEIEDRFARECPVLGRAFAKAGSEFGGSRVIPRV
jgi:hypothetical protein